MTPLIHNHGSNTFIQYKYNPIPRSARTLSAPRKQSSIWLHIHPIVRSSCCNSNWLANLRSSVLEALVLLQRHGFRTRLNIQLSQRYASTPVPLASDSPQVIRSASLFATDSSIQSNSSIGYTAPVRSNCCTSNWLAICESLLIQYPATLHSEIQ